MFAVYSHFFVALSLAQFLKYPIRKLVYMKNSLVVIEKGAGIVRWFTDQPDQRLLQAVYAVEALFGTLVSSS